MKAIDFSCKHDILLEDEQGLCVPMDEPYYRSREIAPATWQILSDGDYSYLLAGDTEAILIDSGYGAGNIREYCEQLCGLPVPRIINTHHHFDHTANDGYFDLAYMAEESVKLATIPFPSFDGIDFPRTYNVQIVEHGDEIPLAGRDLLVLKIPDHAVSSIALLDRKARILFSGDELGMPFGKPINTTVANWAALMERLVPYRGDYDAIYGGGGSVDADIVEKYLENCRAILAGTEGVPFCMPPFNNYVKKDEQGRTIWKRRLPHPGDGPKEWHDDSEWKRKLEYAGCAVVYDNRKIR